MSGILGQGQLGDFFLGDSGEEEASGNFAYGQAQAQIIATPYKFAQSQANIKQIYNGYAQAQARIKKTYQGYGQAQGYLQPRGFGQAQAWICWTDTFTRTTTFGMGTGWTWTDYISDFTVASDSTFRINGTQLINDGPAASDSYYLNNPIPTDATISWDIFISQNFIDNFYYFGVDGWDVVNQEIPNNPIFMYVTGNGPGSNSVEIGFSDPIAANVSVTPNSLYHFKFSYISSGDLAAKIWKDGDPEPNWLLTGNFDDPFPFGGPYIPPTHIILENWMDSSIYIDNFQICIPEAFTITRRGYAQAKALIHRPEGYGQARARIKKEGINRHGQARAKIKQSYRGYAQGQAFIFGKSYGIGNAQASIDIQGFKFAQAQALIAGRGFSQAQALIKTKRWAWGQAQASIRKKNLGWGQAQALILSTVISGNAQAYISLVNRTSYGQAQGLIKGTIAFGYAQAWIEQNRPGTLVKYNSILVPGYLQEESIENPMRINVTGTIYGESYSEYIGLENKILSIRMKVVQETYQEAKEKVLLAGTILRSNREGWTRLTVVDPSKYYLAKTQSINMSQRAGVN